MFRKKSIILYSVLILLVFGFILVSTNIVLASILPPETGSGGCGTDCGNYSLNDFVQLAVNVSDWILGIVGSLALLMFIYGGVVLLISSGNSERVTQGRQILLGAIIGIVIVFTSYMIIQFAMKSLGVVNDSGEFEVSDFDGEWKVAPE